VLLFYVLFYLFLNFYVSANHSNALAQHDVRHNAQALIHAFKSALEGFSLQQRDKMPHAVSFAFLATQGVQMSSQISKNSPCSEII